MKKILSLLLCFTTLTCNVVRAMEVPDEVTQHFLDRINNDVSLMLPHLHNGTFYFCNADLNDGNAPRNAGGTLTPVDIQAIQLMPRSFLEKIPLIGSLTKKLNSSYVLLGLIVFIGVGIPTVILLSYNLPDKTGGKCNGENECLCEVVCDKVCNKVEKVYKFVGGKDICENVNELICRNYPFTSCLICTVIAVVMYFYQYIHADMINQLPPLDPDTGYMVVYSFGRTEQSAKLLRTNGWFRRHILRNNGRWYISK